jgi:hypothetical protein
LRRIGQQSDTEGVNLPVRRSGSNVPFCASRLTTLRTLLPVLERAAAGSARLDLLISYVVEGASSDDLRRIELFRSEGYLPERIAALLGQVPHPYTTRLDAVLPGENIILSMYSAARGRWAAIHRTPEGEETLRWGATEALARRIATLSAIESVGVEATQGIYGEAARPPDASSGGAGAPQGADLQTVAEPQSIATDAGEPIPWKILF